jgi:flagellar protein FlaG
MDNNIMSIAGAAYGQLTGKPQHVEKKTAKEVEATRFDTGVPEEVSKASAKANQPVAVSQTKMDLVIHQATKRVVIRFTDSDTGQVVREIPPEKYLDMVADFLQSVDLAKGNKLDTTI